MWEKMINTVGEEDAMSVRSTVFLPGQNPAGLQCAAFAPSQRRVSEFECVATTCLTPKHLREMSILGSNTVKQSIRL